jgi:hypothetical protein
MTARGLLRATALAASVALLGCGGVFAPRFPQDIATALAKEPMSRLETPDMLLYYPTRRHAEALRFLERVEGCANYWRNQTRIHNQLTNEKIFVVMPEVPFNNAFVEPDEVGYEEVAVVPSYNTLDFFTVEAGLPPDPSFIGCHEITHYVHFKQIGGFAWFWDTVFGDVYSPQVGLDPWFDEGLAVYSETVLQPGTGRLAWPFWNGIFAAGVAGKRINGGDLSVYNRVFDGGNHYLFGSQFVRFLAERYGELRLWRLIEVQGRSFFFPLGVNLRFWQVYDKTLSDLIDEFADATAARFPPVARPPAQRVLRDAGTNARYARAPDGTEALVTQDLDRPARLQIYAPDGRRLIDRDLTDVAPPRDLKISAASVTGGMSFTSDGRWLYFAAQDLGATFQVIRLLRLEVATNQLSVVARDLHGTGGSISPDGRRYLFARAEGDRHDLVELDLSSGVARTLVTSAPRHYFTAPRFSPDGRRVVVTSFDGQRFGIAVLAADDGRPLAAVPLGSGPAFDPSWVDDHRLLFLGVTDRSPGFQVYLHDLDAKTTLAVTQAPFLAFEPRAAGGGTMVRFLNREGWKWTLDEVALPAAAVKATPPVPTTATPPTAGGRPLPPATPFARLVTRVIDADQQTAPPAGTGAAAPPTGGAPPPATSFKPAPPAAPPPDASRPPPAPPPGAWPPPAPPPSSSPPPAPPLDSAAPPPPSPADVTPPPPAPPPANVTPPPPAAPPPTDVTPPPPSSPPPPSPMSQAPPSSLPLAPGAGLPPAVSMRPLVLSETPYSAFDHLFVPQLRSLAVQTAGRAGQLYGAVLDGGDRLSMHRWLLFGYFQPSPASGLLSGGAGYSNQQLAPFSLSLSASQYSWRDVPARPSGSPAPTVGDFTLTKRQRNAEIALSRLFYENPVSLSFLLTEDDEPNDSTVAIPLRRFAGPSLFASFTGVESTPYSGDRRLLAGSLFAAAFPRQWGTAGFNVFDLRGELDVTLPLPLSRRHTLHLGLRGRDLAGTPESAPILQVGGAAAGFAYHRSDRPSTPDFSSDILPPGISFFEPLRGYEDFAIATDRVAIADASYRYPVIIDWGTASTLGILPAFFLSQLNLELFFAGAVEGRAATTHAAAGAALGVDFALLGQWSAQYQFAQRLQDDRARVHSIFFGTGW